MTISGLEALKAASIAVVLVRSYSCSVGMKIFLQPRAFSFSVTKLPRKPAPPVSIMRFDDRSI